jgi:hypothetical protein
MLPLPLAPENQEAVAAALAAVNPTLSGSRFVVADDAICHVSGAPLAEDGSLPSNAVELALATTRAACDTHFLELFRAAVSEDRPGATTTPGLPPGSDAGDRAFAELQLAVAAHRPGFSHRLERPVLVEDIENPWFRQHRILFVQSPSPMPAIGIVVGLTPSGRVRVLSGQVAALNEVALGEGIELTDDRDARAYANVVTSWTRDADFPEMPVDRFDEIPFRRNLAEAERAEIERLRRDVGHHLAPRSFVRAAGGWRLDVWLVSVSRLVHRTADLRTDGTLQVRDEIVVPKMAVPAGAAWRRVGDRLVPVG